MTHHKCAHVHNFAHLIFLSEKIYCSKLILIKKCSKQYKFAVVFVRDVNLHLQVGSRLKIK